MNLGTKLRLKPLSDNIFIFKNLFHFSKICTNIFSSICQKGKHGHKKIPCASNNIRKNILSTFYPVQLKKRIVKKKKGTDSDLDGYRVTAFSTSEEYDLQGILEQLPKLTSFKSSEFNGECSTLADAIHMVNSYNGSENQHIFFFRGGSVVMWNISDVEIKSILNFLKNHEDNSFPETSVTDESEFMNYLYSSDVKCTKILNERIIFPANENDYLQKYAISNAMALSVHLGTFEASLEEYIESMTPVTEDLREGRRIKMSRNEVLKKTGQLFALRHNINLNSDLLDTPDFYWDREDLENIYLHFCNYFCINKRTKVMNEKINHCIELVDLLSTNLNDKHHTRLEWMIIILIMVEVVFEILHYYEKYEESQMQNAGHL